jgi:STE24 endopeptidase
MEFALTESAQENKTAMERPVLDEERQKKAREYSSIRRRLSLGETGLSLVILLILTFTGVPRWFTGLFHLPSIVTAIIFFLVLMIGYELVISPLSYYNGFILSHRYGISTQSRRSWLADLGKGGALSLALGTAAIAIFYWFLTAFPSIWWLLAWGVMLVVSILMSIIAPVFLVPLFYKVSPLEDTDLKSRLEQLAAKAGAKINGIFILDFSAKVTSANAALMGMGRTRRIVISDTLVQQYSIPEIEVVTAHEIGHHMNQDIIRLFLFQSAVFLLVLISVNAILGPAVIFLGFNGPADPADLPLLILIFGALTMLVSPLSNYFSRLVESQADEYALQLTHNPQGFIDSMTRLANQNLAVARPAGWEEVLFYDHPSYNKRVTHARSFERRWLG